MRDVHELDAALRSARPALIVVALLSAGINVLMLASPVYMMLVYDSVLPSQSLPTLVGLLGLVTIVYLFQAWFDQLRSRMLGEIAFGLDRDLGGRVQQAAFVAALRRPDQPDAPAMAGRDLDNIRNTLAGGALGALMDLPWVPFFVVVLALLHWWLAVVTLVGAAIMAALTYASHRASAGPTKRLAKLTATRSSLAAEGWRHAEAVQALGMGPSVRARWLAVNDDYLAAQADLGRASGDIGALARVFRTFLQSAILTVGAVLVIAGKSSGGVIFASSILSGRALAPLDQIIGHWKGLEIARDSWRRLALFLKAVPAEAVPPVALPTPVATLAVDDIVVLAPGGNQPCVRAASFDLVAGDVLGVIGSSGSGKSSLVRALVGAWAVTRGAVRLDGATLAQYEAATLGAAIGYLPQDVALLDGTIAENIARFNPAADSAAIVRAAQAAGIHDLIVGLPQGYATKLGPEGAALSGGQQQRVALARALYGDPFLVVLDEPNANLDGEGEAALDAAVRAVAARGGIVVIVAHRAVAIQRANKLAYMADGTMVMWGPREAVLSRLQQRPVAVAEAAEGMGQRA